MKPYSWWGTCHRDVDIIVRLGANERKSRDDNSSLMPANGLVMNR